MNYHICRLVLSSLCVGVFAAAGIWWCSFCRLQPANANTPPNTSRNNKRSNTLWTENKTTDVVIYQHSRKLLKMDILMSETCWAHNKWNKIANDIKLLFHSSTIEMMRGPINIRCIVTSLQAGRLEFRNGEEIHLFSKHSDPAFKMYRLLFIGNKAAGAWGWPLTSLTPVHLMWRLRISGASSLYSIMLCTSVLVNPLSGILTEKPLNYTCLMETQVSLFSIVWRHVDW